MTSMLTFIIVLVILNIILIVAEIVLDIKLSHTKYDYPIFVCDRLIMGGGCKHDCEHCEWRRDYR